MDMAVSRDARRMPLSMWASLIAIARLRWPAGWQPVAAFAAMLFAPTVFLNGAHWGQSDIIYATFRLVKSDLRARVCFGNALAIKLQAVWLAPSSVWLPGGLPIGRQHCRCSSILP